MKPTDDVPDDDGLALDYASGELDAEKVAEVEARMETDPEFRALVATYQFMWRDRDLRGAIWAYVMNQVEADRGTPGVTRLSSEAFQAFVAPLAKAKVEELERRANAAVTPIGPSARVAEEASMSSDEDEFLDGLDSPFWDDQATVTLVFQYGRGGLLPSQRSEVERRMAEDPEFRRFAIPILEACAAPKRPHAELQKSWLEFIALARRDDPSAFRGMEIIPEDPSD